MARTARTVTALIASGGLAAGMGLAGAPALAAGGAGPSAQVSTASQSGEWPEYTRGQMGWDVAVAKYLLWEQGYYEPYKVVDHVLDDRALDSLMDYQQDTDLKVTGVLDARSWEFLVEDAGPVRQGDESYTVSAVQTALSQKHGYDLAEDGYSSDTPGRGTFGAATHDAVTGFQQEAGLEADGEVDAATFKALVAG
ncbi:peptidoglycan-binding domain-containing protein [Nocardiopsis tropica]|uniref:Peptidoglycan-binding domain-containing protein n=1 Tax=Nocardiopsis tropica TaxID=109330 RepID=A0ABV2A315_9ACTN